MQKKYYMPKVIINVFMCAVCALFILPLAYIIAISFTPQKDIALYGYQLIPLNPTLLAYNYVLANVTAILRAYGVTIFVTAAGTSLSVLITSMLAYVLSRRDFLIAKYLNLYVLFTMLFSGGMVSSYIFITQYLHLKDNILVLILPMLVSPWHLFLMRGFMRDLPSALIESAKIDGASETRTFFNIVIPLSKPSLATIGIFAAFGYWNDWWLSLMYIDNRNLMPIQLFLYRVQATLATLTQQGGANVDMSTLVEVPADAALMVVCIMATAPMMLVFPFFQRFFVKGMTVGSIKG